VHFFCKPPSVSYDHMLGEFYHAAGFYFWRGRFDIRQAMQFCNKALDLSKLCRDAGQQCNFLLSIAHLKCRTGDYCTAQAHIAEALQLLKLYPNLYLEAIALQIGADCSLYLGNFLQAIDNLHKARVMHGICGLSGGGLDHKIAIHQGEIHFRKSEYA
jgi:tetratricopeptide (TPR) repeat protein